MSDGLPEQGCSPAVYTFGATLAEVTQTVISLKERIPLHFDPEQRYAIELGIVEVLTNVVQHGYAGSVGQQITLHWRCTDEGVSVDVFDDGKPIPENLLDRSVDDALGFDADQVEQLPEGGMGLALTKLTFDVMRYNSANGSNHMHLEKSISRT